MNQEIPLDTFLVVYLYFKKCKEQKEESFEKISEYSSQPFDIWEEMLDIREPEENDVQIEEVNNASAFSEKTHCENNQSEHKAWVNNENSEKEKEISFFEKFIKEQFDLDEVSFQNKIKQIQQKSNSINQQNPEYDKLIIQISEIQKNKNEQDLQPKLNSQINQQQLQGEQIVKFKIKQNRQKIQEIEQIESLSFSKDDTLIAVSDQNLIKIFQFEEGKMTEIDELEGPLLKINCLEFMKKQNLLISGGKPRKGNFSIYVFQYSNNNKGIFKNNYSESPTTCMITNHEETILYTGDEYGSVAKWDIKSEKHIKIIDEKFKVHKNTVYGISLNASQTKMITCSKQEKGKVGGKVLVWGEVQGTNPLNVIANIDLENFGCRILYTSEEEILFQLKEHGLLQFIVEDGKKQNKKLIFKMKSSKDHYLFPMQYNENQNIGVCKQGDIVYLFRKNKNNDFELLKELKTLTVNNKQNNIEINGILSNNGKWLVIQNQNELHIQQILV